MSEFASEELYAEQFLERLNALVEELENYPDAEVRDKALDLVQIIMELYGEGLRRVLASIDLTPLKEEIMSRLLSDEVVRAILLIHGLLPVALEERVQAALDHLRPQLISQGADAKLVRIADGRAQIRLIRSGRDALPIATLKDEIEKALIEAAPDLEGIEIERLSDQLETARKADTLLKQFASQPGNGAPQPLIQIKRPQPDKKKTAGAWVPVIRAMAVEEGQLRIISFDEINLLVCRIAGEVYSYQNRCASGERSLDDAMFESPFLTCVCHGYRYDLRRAGACVEKPELRLESLPVIVEDDKVKVAL